MPEFGCEGYASDKKVDYTIFKDGKPIIIVECKDHNVNILKHEDQIKFYFRNTQAKMAILTNGVKYRFYSDLKQPNILDDKPFFTFDITNVTDKDIAQLELFSKDNFDAAKIIANAKQLRCERELKKRIEAELDNPSDELVTLLLKPIVSDWWKGWNEQYRPLVKQMLDEVILERAGETNTIVSINESDKTPQIIDGINEHQQEAFNAISVLLNNFNLQYNISNQYVAVSMNNVNEYWWFVRIYKSLPKFVLELQTKNDDKKTLKLDTIDELKQHEAEIRESIAKAQYRSDEWNKTHKQ